MSGPDAPRPPAGTEGRASDRTDEPIDAKCNPRPQVDGYRRGTFDRWASHRDRVTAWRDRCQCGAGR